jgi:hypothetical protein
MNELRYTELAEKFNQLIIDLEKVISTTKHGYIYGIGFSSTDCFYYDICRQREINIESGTDIVVYQNSNAIETAFWLVNSLITGIKNEN